MFFYLFIDSLPVTFILGYLIGRNAPSKTANIIFTILGFLVVLLLLGINQLGHLDSGQLDSSDVTESIVGGLLIVSELMIAKLIANRFKKV